MSFCTRCGKLIKNNSTACNYCGYTIKAHLNTNPEKVDRGNFGWWLLGFLVPIVGLILWLIWRSDTPLKAKSIGIGALVGALISAIPILIIILLSLVMVLMYYYNVNIINSIMPAML